MYIVSNRGIDNSKIEEFEKRFGLVLPEDYKDFLFHTNGGILNDEKGVSIHIPNTEIDIAVKEFYGIGLNEHGLETINYRIWDQIEAMDISVNMDEEEKEQSNLPELSSENKVVYNLLVIGEDILGQYIVINFIGDVSFICYWDNEMKFSKPDEENAYYISSSFEEFVHIIEKNEKGDENMEKVNYLPLGSIILMEGGIQKLIITSRGLVVQHNGEEVFFDYAGVPYPQGLISDDLLYFNHEDIAKVIFEGYKDDDDTVIVGNINKFIESHPNMIKGDPRNWD